MEQQALTILVVGTDDWAVEQANVQLDAAGHETLGCHPLGSEAFPCNAFVPGRTCPLDVGFDAIVDARARAEAAPTAGEMGVICGLRTGAPLITAGITGRNPFEQWTVRVAGTDELADVVERTVAARTDPSVAIDLRDTARTSQRA
jgi:hypothetical protein